MTKKLHIIGEAQRAPAPHSGWIVTLYRYPSGRLLPAPRTLLDTSGPVPAPFSGPSAAMDALRQYRDDIRSITALDVSLLPTPPKAAKPARKRKPAVVAAAAPRRTSYPRPTEPVPAPPPVERLAHTIAPRDDVSQRIDQLIADGIVDVVPCLPGMYQPERHCIRRKGAGVMPGHLDPRGLV